MAAAAEDRHTRKEQATSSLEIGGRRRALVHDTAAAALDLEARRPPLSFFALADGSRACGSSGGAAVATLSSTQRPPPGAAAHAVVGCQPPPRTGSPDKGKGACG